MPISRKQDQREKALVLELEGTISQPISKYKNGGSYVVTEAGKKVRLSSAGNAPTLAGRVFYQQLLGVKPPTRYTYDQSLIQDKWIKGRDGKLIQVRRRQADGTYKIMAAGKDYFRYHTSFWTPLFPRLIHTVGKDGVDRISEARSGFNYIPHSAMTQLSSASLRQSIGTGDDILPSDEAQRAEVLRLATEFAAELDTLTIAGRDYKILYHLSDANHLYDESRPIMVDRQTIEFHNEMPPTTDTILNRPLGALPTLPDAIWRPFDLHEDSLSEWSHNCAVHMLHKSITCRSRTGSGRECARSNQYLPMLTIGTIEADMDVSFRECNYQRGEFPFTTGGWREEGIPSRMLINFCERQAESIACSIFHNGALLYASRPTKPVHQVVFSAQGSHCYFYRNCNQAVRAAEVRISQIGPYACTKVREAFDTEHGKPFTEWQCYTILLASAREGFYDLHRPKRRHSNDDVRQCRESLYFYTKDDDLEAIYLQFKAIQKETLGTEQSFGIRRLYGSDAEQIASLSISARNLPRLSIRAVPMCADDLVEIARASGFIYKGSSIAKFGDDLRMHCYKRVNLPDTDKQAILKNQDYKCATCQSDERLEFDHKVPFSAGSPSDLESYQALCVTCHRMKGEEERHVYGSAWSSRLSRDLLEGLVNAPAPRQQVWGDGEEGFELDVVQSRPYGLQKSARLPITDVLDKLELWDPTMEWDTIDFIFIDAGPCSEHQRHYTAYGGPQWFARELVEFILQHEIESQSGLITTGDFSACLRASRSISGVEVERVFDRMRAAVELGLQTTGNYERAYAEKLPKLVILSMLGRWNTKVTESWECCETTCRDDAHATVHKDRKLTGDFTKYMTRFQTLSNKSMVLFSLVSLNMEQLAVCTALQLARRCRLQIHGCIVDSVIVNGTFEQLDFLKRETERLMRPDGSQILQVKDGLRAASKHVFSERIITAKLSPWRPFTPCQGERLFSPNFGKWYTQPHFAHQRTWRRIIEPEGIGSCDANDTFQAWAAQQCVDNGGGCVFGRGGVGKSELIKRLREKFESLGETVYVLATTHVQAAQIEGDTVLMHLHRLARTKESVLILDELSMVSLPIFSYIAEGQLVGRKICVVGDPYQIPPVGQDPERWSKLLGSDFLHDLCGGLEIQLRAFRRRKRTSDPLVFLPGDWKHFSQVGAFYPKAGECEHALLPEAIRIARLLYPIRGGVETTLCVTNKRRILINSIENLKRAPFQAVTCTYTGTDPRAQSMILWKGMKLTAGVTDRKHGLKNALEWTVESTDNTSCTVIDSKHRSLTIPTSEMAALFRLTYARTIDSSQALTIQHRCALVECSHHHFNLRRLIVALGRVPCGDMIEVH